MLRWDGNVTPLAVPSVDAYKVRLVVGRKLYDEGVAVRMSPALAPLAAPAVLQVNPTDLERLGVASGGTVRIRSDKATFTVTVEASPHQPRGTAHLPYNAPGLDVGALLPVGETVVDVGLETVS